MYHDMLYYHDDLMLVVVFWQGSICLHHCIQGSISGWPLTQIYDYAIGRPGIIINKKIMRLVLQSQSLRQKLPGEIHVQPPEI